MEDLCPLCLKNGRKRSVQLFQVNLQEAVRMCEEDECPWPFGYKPFTFHPRIVGKIWSYYWDDHSSKPKESLSSSTKQQPLRSKITTDPLITLQTSSINHFQSNGLCEQKEKEEKALDHDCHAALRNEPENKEFRKNSVEPSNNSHTINNSFESVDLEKDNEDAGKEPLTQTKNINASEKLPPVTQSTSAQADKFLSEGCSGATEVESSINTTEVKIGLPPIKLSYKIPLCPTVASNLKESTEGAVSSDRKSSATMNAVAKCSVMSGKQYAKFSFCNIKKTLGTAGSTDVSNNNQGNGNCSGKVSIRQEIIVNGNGDDGKLNGSIGSSSDSLNNSLGNGNCSGKISLGQEIIINGNGDSGKLNGSIGSSSDFSKNSCGSILENSWTKTDSVNIDTVLDNFLSNNCGDGKDVNDDWINSLLT